jgi:ribose transport system permease protein
LAEYGGLALALGLLILVFSLKSERFFSAATFQTIANLSAPAIIIATGMTYVLIIAGIDLSVGSVLGLCGAVVGVCMVELEWPLACAMIASLGAGLACGAFNGIVSIRWGLPSFIVTLGMLEIARGAAHLITDSRTQYIGSDVEWIAGAKLGGLSIAFLFAVAIVMVAQLVLSRTVFGRYLVAIGANEEAVRLSGIDPRPIKLTVFLLSGFLVALAAIVETSKAGSAIPSAGIGYELQAIAAAVIGGTSLMGGRGSVISSFFGVLIIAVLNQGLATIGAEDETKRVVTGLVIVAAVILDQYRQRIRSPLRT